MAGDVDEIFPLLLAQRADVVELAAERLFPNRIPQRDSVPAVVWERTGGSPIGNSGGYSAVSWATFRLTSYSGKSQQEAAQLNLAVQGIKGGARKVGSWWVQSLRVMNGTDQSEPREPIDGTDLPPFSASAEFTVFYKRSGGA